jgi:O-acetyl-ADP-ribose deacetylase (regulator of RNase III)
VRPGVRCPTGEARITPGFALPAAWVIHTVGPVYRGSESEPLLRSAHRASLQLARDEGLTSIAFPAISCGVFGYPVHDAARIALTTCSEHGSALKQVRFALFGDEVFDIFRSVAERLVSEQLLTSA